MHWIALQPDEQEELAALGWQALQFSPKVAQVSVGAGLSGANALVVEISASERLFGGTTRLLSLIGKKNKALGPVKYAQAATSLVAMARLQLRQYAPCAPCAIGSLPLHTLAAAQPHLATLARVGCTRWGELRALPRGGVVRRFGADLLDALDRAYGLKPEIYPWVTLPEVFEAKIELQAQVETAPALMFGAQRLFKQLQLWLQLRHCGVAALELGWTMDARRNTASHGELLLRTAEPTQDIAHLQRLLGENLARLTLPAPVLYLSLRTRETEPLAGVSAGLLLEETQKGDSLHQMVERLCARLGAENVLLLQTQADHRPEFRQNWISINKKYKNNTNTYTKLIANKQINTRLDKDKNHDKLNYKKFTSPEADALYPTWLLHQPLPLALLQGVPHYQGPLTLLAGPQRLETGWFDTPALRDYFIAQSQQGGLLWVYRERLGGLHANNGWYLHGRFD